jgi:phenylacetate-CoA ligase
VSDHFDPLETRHPDERERELFERLPGFLTRAAAAAPALGRRLAGVDLASIGDRQALARLPVLRKAELMAAQQAAPPFGGFASSTALTGTRVFQSPGPIWEPQGPGSDPWQTARALFAAGIRRGDKLHNAFSYHMTPGGFVIDEGARALGCLVFPAGTGNTDQQVEAAERLRPTIYCGTPDFLLTMLDRAAELGRDLSFFRIGLVSGGALFPSLRAEYRQRGIRVLQCYATAELGVVAYETGPAGGDPHPGMVVNENLIVEIVRPGTGEPVPEGEVGEVVVTAFNEGYPLVRLATGDLSAVLPGSSPCGRTNTRIAGWMGRADQRTKVKGMFIDPAQLAELGRRHHGIARVRLVVGRADNRDVMTLLVEPAPGAAIEAASVAATLRELTKLGGAVEVVAQGSLPNDGLVIADDRDYGR